MHSYIKKIADILKEHKAAITVSGSPEEGTYIRVKNSEKCWILSTVDGIPVVRRYGERSYCLLENFQEELAKACAPMEAHSAWCAAVE